MSRQILGMHDWSPEWGQIVKETGLGGWCCVTEAIGSDARDTSGRDYTSLASYGVEPIVRLNHAYGMGHGTIPKPEQYEAFARRCGNFVRASRGCSRWIIGNETNMKWESPYADGRLISVDDYARCFRLCRERILAAQPDAEVMPAPVAPWNAQQGDWLILQRCIWEACWPFEGIAIHAYTHGHDPLLVTSDATMNPPYDKHCYHFRVYLDFMMSVPKVAEALPVYVTEANPDGWQNVNNGWVQQAAKEIDDWNKRVGHQQIHALCLYRWPDYDREQFTICNKQGVIADFRQGVGLNVRVEPKAVPNTPEHLAGDGGMVDEGAEPLDEEFESLTVVNVRSGPGIEHRVVDQLMTGEVIQTIGCSSAPSASSGSGLETGNWVKTERGWCCTVWNGYPLLQRVASDNWGRAIEHVFKWEGGYVNDPRDPGGETNMGISKRSYPHLDIANLTREDAVEIYRRDYWMKSGANELSWPLCLTHFDFAVNAGTWRANVTLVESQGDFERYNELRERFYRSIRGFVHFGQVWLRRVADIRKAGE